MITKFKLYCETTEYKEGNLKVIYRDDKLTVAVPNNLKSSQITCRGTKWCTAKEDQYDYWTKERNMILFRFLFRDGYKIRLSWGKYNDGEKVYNPGSWGSGGEKYYEIPFGDYAFDYKKIIENIRYTEEYLEKSHKKYDELSNNKDKYNPEEYQEEIDDCKETIERLSEILETKKEIFERIKSIPKEAIEKVIEFKKSKN